MSSSDRSGGRFRAVTSADARLSILDGNDRHLEQDGVGSLELELPAGIYTVRSELLGRMVETVVRHSGNTELTIEGPPLYSAAPLTGAKTSHEYYTLPAERLSKQSWSPPLGAGAASGALFLFARRARRDGGSAAPGWHGITIHDAENRAVGLDVSMFESHAG
jgi:hypothetical protein